MATARDSEDVNCICGVDHDDGKWMICCDVCNTWLHTNCLRLTKRKIKALVTFKCPRCVIAAGPSPEQRVSL